MVVGGEGRSEAFSVMPDPGNAGQSGTESERCNATIREPASLVMQGLGESRKLG